MSTQQKYRSLTTALFWGKWACYVFFAAGLMPKQATAQTPVGHAIVYEHFGAGNNNPALIGTPLPDGRTQYLFSNQWCPPAGAYTIARRVNLNGCNNSSPHGWISLGSDRTSDYDPSMANGNMMLVNNVTHVQTVYVDTVEANFCPGTVYTFQASIINLERRGNCNAGLSKFVLSVEPLAGQFVYMSYTTGSIYFQDTTRIEFGTYGDFFTMPPGVTKAIVKVVAYPDGPPGNDCGFDFAIDDIILKAVGPSVSVNFENTPRAEWVKSVCFQDNKTIKMEGLADSYYTNTAYQWEQSTNNGLSWTDIPGATSRFYQQTFSVPDTFLFRLRAAELQNIGTPSCGVVSASIKVEVDDIPRNYTINNNSPVCAGSELKFNAEGAASYIWTGPNNFFDNVPFPQIAFSSLRDSGWYYCEIKSLGGCKNRDSTYARIIGTDVDAWPDTVICAGNSVKLNVTAGKSYSWSPVENMIGAATSRVIVTPRITTTYTVRHTDTFGCSDTAQVTVTVRNKTPVKAIFECNEFLCPLTDSITFTNHSEGEINSWVWSFGNGQSSVVKNPPTQFYFPNGSIDKYLVHLTVSDTAGCTDELYKWLTAVPMCNLAVPAAFTPNNDGLNDYLYPLNTYKVKTMTFKVFSRNGQLVFQSSLPQGKWDGSINGMQAPAGVYVWMLSYITYSGQTGSSKGTVLLMR